MLHIAIGRLASIAWLGPGGNDACDIADQGNNEADEGNAEPVELAQDAEPDKHGKSYCKQIDRAEEKLGVAKRQKAEDEAEQDERQPVTGIEARPSPQHSRFFGDAEMGLVQGREQAGIAWQQTRARESIDQMNNAQQEDNACARCHEDFGRHNASRSNGLTKISSATADKSELCCVVKC